MSDAKFDVYKCQSCNVDFTDVENGSAYYEKYYPLGYYEEPSSNPFIRALLDLLTKICFYRRLFLIKRHFPKKKEIKILEIGCGRGEFLDFLPQTFKKYGVEINKDGYSYIKEKRTETAVFGEKITDPAFDNTGYPYDVIGMWHVFEHIDEPHIFLAKIAKILSKEGILIFDIPNSASLGFRLTKKYWFHLDVPRHLFFYNFNVIQGLMKSHGFKIVHYSGNPIDYFQDLSASFYNKFIVQNIFCFILAFIFLPLSLPGRALLSIFFPNLAEINTYIVKHAS